MNYTYHERAKKHKSKIVQKLFNLIEEKKTNLCSSIDVTSTNELLDLANKLGPYVCLIKTHIDIIEDFDYNKTILPLLDLSIKHNFMIFEDRKFSDIGNTVNLQFSKGIYNIVSWADIVNAYVISGYGAIEGLKKAANDHSDKPRALLLISELSTKGSLAVGEFTKSTIQLAEEYKDFVIGFISQKKIVSSNPEHDWIILTPGVSLDETTDNLGQNYRSVDDVINNGADVIIVGRGLCGKGKDPVAEAKRYKKYGWNAYLKRIKK